MNKLKFFLSCLLAGTSLVALAQISKAPLPAAAVPGRYMPLLEHKRLALVMNQTSRVGDSLLVDMLLARGADVKLIMSPEHGFRGREDAGAHVDNSTDSATGLPVVSLYGKHRQPTAEDLAAVDVVVYDLQDVGVRFYTYISTLQYVMEACAIYGKTLVVLDRPNPNGFYVDGPVLEPEHRSFVGMQPIPIVYGMTAGEYAKMLDGEHWLNTGEKRGREPLTMKVITCLNYDHKKKYELPVAPSPNLRTMAAVYAYPDVCLFEGTPVSVGRGTDKPFQQWGAPELKNTFTHSFTPVSGPGAKDPPQKGKVCYGQLVGTTSAGVLNAIGNRIRLDWLIKAYNAWPDKEHFFTPYFIQLCGTTKLQDQVKKGETEEQIRVSWQKDLNAFKTIRKKYLLYAD